MATPQLQLQFLNKVQLDANCDSFETHFQQIMFEWNRSLELWEKHITFIQRNMVLLSQQMMDHSRNLFKTFAEIFREILTMNSLEAKFSKNRIMLDAIREYCQDAQLKLKEGNKHLVQSYEYLLTDNLRRAEMLNVYISSSFESCRELLRLGNDRIQHNISRQIKLNRTLITVFFVGGNAAMWGFGTFFAYFYATKYPTKVLTFATLISVTCYSMYQWNKYKGARQQVLQRNVSPLQDLNKFIEGL